MTNEEPEDGYDEWFRMKVQESTDDPRPSIPNEVVVERTTAIIETFARAATRVGTRLRRFAYPTKSTMSVHPTRNNRTASSRPKM